MQTRELIGRGPLTVVAAMALSACGSSSTTSHPTPTPRPEPYLVSYTATSGHFSALFPSTPTEQSVPASFANYQLEIHAAVGRGSSGPAEVGEEDIQPALPSDQFQPALSAALQNFSIGSGLAVKSQPKQTTYRGVPSMRATYSGRGLNITVLAFMSGDTRLYFLVAPNDEIGTLMSSFQIVG